VNLKKSFWTNDRKIYYYSDSKPAGWFKTSGSFSFGVVPDTGHFAPEGNYKYTKYILDDMITFGKMQCHHPDGKHACSVVSKMCEAMNNCNHGTCESNGLCKCEPWYRGGDCSYKALHSSESKKWENTVLGTDWLYYTHHTTSLTENFKVKITSKDYLMNVLVKKGSPASPTKYDFDMNFKSVSQLTISQDQIQGNFTVAIETLGYDFGKNHAN